MGGRGAVSSAKGSMYNKVAPATRRFVDRIVDKVNPRDIDISAFEKTKYFQATVDFRTEEGRKFKLVADVKEGTDKLSNDTLVYKLKEGRKTLSKNLTKKVLKNKLASIYKDLY